MCGYVRCPWLGVIFWEVFFLPCAVDLWERRESVSPDPLMILFIHVLLLEFWLNHVALR